MSTLVLIVDDQVDNRAIYRALLTHLGYDIAEASEGDEAIRIATAQQPSVILMDMSLPGRDGWSATRVLKGDARTAHIPIIALTAHASEEARARAEQAGVDSFMVKPVVPRAVEEEIRRFLPSQDSSS